MSTPGETKESKEIEGEVEASEEFLPVFLNEQIGKLAKQEKFADVLFVVGDKKFHAHRLILAASSPLFEEMLYERLESGDVNPVLKSVPLTVEIKETDSDSFSALLDCIYSDKVEVTATNIQTLIKVATKYQVEKLKIVCAEFMEGDVTKDNVLDLFQIAPSMLGDEEFGLKFIEENAEDVLAGEAVTKLTKDRFAVILKSDKLTLEEVEVFKLLQKWAAAEVKKAKDKTDVKTVVKDLIKLIRFPAMEIAQLASVVSPSGLLEQTQLVGLFSYLSVTDEKVRALLPDPGFPTEPRESGSNWTWDTKKKGRYSTLTNNNLTAATTGSSYNYGLVLGTKEFKSGNHYWEVKLDYVSGEMLGVASPSITYDACSIYSAYPSQCWFVHYSSGLYGGSIGTKSSLSLSSTTGDTIGFALQWNKSTSNFDLTVYRNKRLVGTPFRGIPAPVVAAVEFYSSPARVTLTTKVKKPTT